MRNSSAYLFFVSMKTRLTDKNMRFLDKEAYQARYSDLFSMLISSRGIDDCRTFVKHSNNAYYFNAFSFIH